MKKLIKQNGITLIALVITIVVLIILAGITMNMLLGDNGILTKVREATIADKKASIDEEVKIALSSYIIDKAKDSNTDIKQVLEQELDKNELTSVTTNNKVVVIIYKGETFKYDLGTGEKADNPEFDVWDGATVSTGLIGEGTEIKPYLIRSAEDLLYMIDKLKTNKAGGGSYEKEEIIGLEEDGKTANNCNLCSNKAQYKLMTNIAINDVSEYDKWGEDSFDKSKLNVWNPAGIWISDSSKFVFDGNNYEITGLYHVSSSDDGYIGFFVGGYGNIEVRNLILTNVFFKGYGYKFTGGIMGYAEGGDIKIDNCCVDGIVENGNGENVGGILGQAGSGTVVTNCVSYAKVFGKYCIGGICGYITGYSNQASKVENCKFFGSIGLNKSSIQGIGGIIGYSSGVQIRNCYNYGRIYIVDESIVKTIYKIGGIAGELYNSYGTIVIVENCYNYGEIPKYEVDTGILVTQIGGIIGAGAGKISNVYNYTDISILKDTSSDYYGFIGGIFGQYDGGQEGSYIKNCDNYGNVTTNDNNNAGGIIGVSYGNYTFENCNNYGTISNGRQLIGSKK